ncbi:hypothetical protein J2W54_004965 [Rhodococcus fascians]|uniref:hypothetical protein n=1 Tax=Nocardiaceae TaxID=85025 RepID=UPI00285DD210|nr:MULTISPECIES: hypothetical protein [Rhodococcus]MDR6912952.1 hypothetical protein [Rhodococcus sp. 3258]MDR6934549.1 hypothetical protein [Rhodococcus fascians]
MTPRGSTVSGYSYQWSLFVDWCAAADVEALPASPITLAQFLAENPAGDAVQLRRVSAINRAHLDAGQPAPGRVTSIRIALDSARSDRTFRRAEQNQAIAAGLPISGSTAALFGRRDAVLLVLAGAGLSHRAIAELDRTDITTDGDGVWIGGRHRVSIAPNGTTGVEPATIWDRWHTVLQFSERYPSTTLLAEHLQRNTFPDMTGLPQRRGPVAVPIDRWGHLPLPVTAMTAAEVGAVIARHRAGVSPLHTPRRPVIRPSDGTDRRDPSAAPEPVSADLDSRYYRSGVEARRRAHTALADVPDMVDDVEDRIEQLLERTLHLLGSSDRAGST